MAGDLADGNPILLYTSAQHARWEHLNKNQADAITEHWYVVGGFSQSTKVQSSKLESAYLPNEYNMTGNGMAWYGLKLSTYFRKPIVYQKKRPKMRFEFGNKQII